MSIYDEIEIERELESLIKKFLWFLVALFLLGYLLGALTGCTSHPELVTAQHPKPGRTVKWCETSGGMTRCKRVSQDEVRRALEVLGGERL